MNVQAIPVAIESSGEARSLVAPHLDAATVALELAYVAARYAALAPFGKGRALLPRRAESHAER
jgi:phosphotransacetylase